MKTKFICSEDVLQDQTVVGSDEIEEVKGYLYLDGEYVLRHGCGNFTENNRVESI